MKSCESLPRPGESPGSAVLTVGEGRLLVHLELRPVGPDWLLLITGGRAHVGAVAVQGPGCPPARAERASHREGPLAEECAGIIARGSASGCAVVAGIHQDQATAREIQGIVANARRGAELLAAWIKDRPGPGTRNPGHRN